MWMHGQIMTEYDVMVGKWVEKEMSIAFNYS
jgi:hypothetical protein